MIFKELLSEFTDDAILDELIKFDPESDIESYQEVLIELRNKQVILSLSSMKIIIIEEKDEDELICMGIDEKGYLFSLYFTPWSEWLGLEIVESSLDLVSKQKLLAIILWEMTFYGFSESDIDLTMKSINEKVLDIENSIHDEEKE